MAHQIFVVARTIKEAFQNKQTAEELLANPAIVFQRNGLEIPEDARAQFDSYFQNVARDIVARLRESAERQLQVADTQNLMGFWCTTCKIAAWVVAAGIVAVGAAGLASLTVESAIVIALATFAGVSAEAALAFIAGLAAVVAKGTGAVAEAICEWTGVC